MAAWQSANSLLQDLQLLQQDASLRLPCASQQLLTPEQQREQLRAAQLAAAAQQPAWLQPLLAAQQAAEVTSPERRLTASDGAAPMVS